MHCKPCTHDVELAAKSYRPQQEKWRRGGDTPGAVTTREVESPMASTSVTPSELIVRRPSRSGGAPHQVRLGAATLRPLGCTCRAGRAGVVCWAALEAVSVEGRAEARRRYGAVKGLYSDQFAEAVHVLARVERWTRVARAELSRRAPPQRKHAA